MPLEPPQNRVDITEPYPKSEEVIKDVNKVEETASTIQINALQIINKISDEKTFPLITLEPVSFKLLLDPEISDIVEFYNLEK